jgi:hypothetical protein
MWYFQHPSHSFLESHAVSVSFTMAVKSNNHVVKEKNMKNLKKIGAAFVLTCVFGLSAFAGETSTPPCPPPDPGETSTPPCTSAQLADDPTDPGQLETPTAPNEVDQLVVEAAKYAVEGMLAVF